MYNCGFCHNTSKPKESMNRIVTETRDKEYNNHGKVSYGFEIVKEVRACPACFARQATPLVKDKASLVFPRLLEQKLPSQAEFINRWTLKTNE